MKYGFKTRRWTAAWALLAPALLLTLLCPVPGFSAKGIAPAQYGGESESRATFTGALDIRLRAEGGGQDPPAELLLFDPRGDATGRDPRDGSTYQEILGGTFGWSDVAGVPGQEEEVLYVRSALSGIFSLRVIGVDYGSYFLWLRGYDSDMNTADVRFNRMRIQPGEVHYFLVDYSNRGGARLNVRRTRVSE